MGIGVNQNLSQFSRPGMTDHNCVTAFFGDFHPFLEGLEYSFAVLVIIKENISFHGRYSYCAGDINRL